MNKPPPFKSLNIRFLITISINGRGFINQGSTVSKRVQVNNNSTLWFWVTVVVVKVGTHNHSVL